MEIVLAILAFALQGVQALGETVQNITTVNLSKRQTEALRRAAQGINLDAATIAKLRSKRVNSLSDLEKLLSEFPKLRSQINERMNQLKKEDADFEATLADIDAKLNSKRDELYALNNDTGMFGFAEKDKGDKIDFIQNEIDTLTLDKQRFLDEQSAKADNDNTIPMYSLQDKTNLDYLKQSSKGGTEK